MIQNKKQEEDGMDRRTVMKMLGVGLPGLALSPGLFAQAAYPSQTVRVVVPFPVGNAVDLIARLSADALSSHYGQSFVVDNRPGAKGLIGIRYAAEQPRDGYTLVGGGLGNVLPIATLRNLPIDIAATLVPVAQVAEFANVFIVAKDSPLNTIEDLVKYIESHPPAHVTIGAGDIGSSAHLGAALFESRVGREVTHVPYRSQSEIVVNLVGGTLDVGISSVPASLAMLQDQRIKALAITGRTRSRHLPDVPTMEEAGVKDYNVSSWLGMYGTQGTPDAIIQKLGNDLVAKLADPSYTERIEAAGLEASVLGPDAFRDVNNAEIQRWSAFAQQIGAVRDYST